MTLRLELTEIVEVCLRKEVPLLRPVAADLARDPGSGLEIVSSPVVSFLRIVLAVLGLVTAVEARLWSFADKFGVVAE